MKIWIYEYKDAKTPIGATLFKGTVEELHYEFEELVLPHLHPDYHYRVCVVRDE